VYACGGFSLGGPAQSVARWNGRNWSALGAGITNARLDAIAVVNHHVFVGGQFTNAGGIAVNNIAEWDGTSWSAVGGGVTNALASQPAYQVAALLPVGSDLYVAGNFTEAGGIAATNIAKWDGGSWSALGGGLTRADDTGYALALATDGGTLYAGGRFMFAGGQSATNVAKWDGGKWSPLGGGLGTASGYNSFDYDRVFARHQLVPGGLDDR
jgi:hypothetical protein